ncbi:MAG: AAA family ATPase [Bifidobacteriaceae bacterium]|jgi:hypothetical protein|nr:AAA family ATPase [Bifidobacteriaceae bacterium]
MNKQTQPSTTLDRPSVPPRPITTGIPKLEGWTADNTKPRLEVVQSSEVKPLAIDWIIPRLIQKRVINLITGSSTLGKTTLGYKFISITTIWKDKPMKWLVLITEDDKTHAGEKIRGSGGNPNNVYVQQIPKQLAEVFKFDPTSEYALGEIQRVIEEKNIGGIFLAGSVLSYGKGKSNSADDVREALEGLNLLIELNIAKKRELTVIAVAHQNKAQGRNELDSVLGSVEFINVPRCIITLAQDKETRKRFFSSSKLSNGDNDDPQLYEFDIVSHSFTAYDPITGEQRTEPNSMGVIEAYAPDNTGRTIDSIRRRNVFLEQTSKSEVKSDDWLSDETEKKKMAEHLLGTYNGNTSLEKVVNQYAGKGERQDPEKVLKFFGRFGYLIAHPELSGGQLGGIMTTPTREHRGKLF